MIHSTRLSSLKDSHSRFWWETLNINITLFTRQLNREPFICLLEWQLLDCKIKFGGLSKAACRGILTWHDHCTMVTKQQLLKKTVGIFAFSLIFATLDTCPDSCQKKVCVAEGFVQGRIQGNGSLPLNENLGVVQALPCLQHFLCHYK